MAYKFVSHAIDALLNNQTNSVVCFNEDGFSYKSIDEVAKRKYRLDNTLLKSLKEMQDV